MHRAFTCLALVVCFISSVATRQAGDDPERVIRQLVRAIYANDIAAYNRITIDHPLRSSLTTGGQANAEGLRRLEDNPTGLQVQEMRPLLYQGKPLTDAERPPVGTTGLFMAAHQGGPMAVPVVRTAAGWRVDVRWWIAARQMADGTRPLGEMEVSIRSMLSAMLRLDRSRAVRFLTDARNIELLFAGAPRYREPSGVLDAAVEEMPLVEIGAGEFFPMPTGRVVEGGSTESRRVVVGLFGPTEMAFVVRKVGSDWRVEAEPYFVLMNQ